MEKITLLTSVLEAIILAQLNGAENVVMKEAHNGWQYYYTFEVKMKHQTLEVKTETVDTKHAWDIYDKLKAAVGQI